MDYNQRFTEKEIRIKYNELRARVLARTANTDDVFEGCRYLDLMKRFQEIRDHEPKELP